MQKQTGEAGGSSQSGEGAASEKRTQAQRREETRHKLIAAAIDLIHTDGCVNLTTTRVASAAGLTRGAIQYHFSNPKDLLREVVVTIVQQINALVDKADLAGLEKSERLDKLIDHYWEGYSSGIYVVFLEITTRGRLDPELKQVIEEAIGILEQERDEQWLGLFLDYPQSKSEKLNWRATLLVLLRGLAVKQMFASPDDDIEAHYRRCKDMYKRYIEGGPPPL
ncbi:MAG: TetR/AcrR family transcriptional regulator [Sneathiella sp.]